VDRANRRRLGLPGDEDEAGYGEEATAEPPRWYSQPASPRPAGADLPGDGAHPADPTPAGVPAEQADWPFRGPG
jgi:hypothetical protein